MKPQLTRRWVAVALGLLGSATFAFPALLQAAPPARAQTPPASTSLSLEDQTFIRECAAVYRWQFGPKDPTYLKIKGVLDKVGGRPAQLQDVIVFIRRDGMQASFAAGKFKMASSLANCAEGLSLPAPSEPLRSAAFPEEPDPQVVSKMSACLSLQRWVGGPDTFATRDSMGVYESYARKTEEAAEAEVKAGMDNLDKAIDGGLDPKVLMAAKPDCNNDLHVIINGEPDQRHSLEYMKAHPQVASAPPARSAPSYSSSSSSSPSSSSSSPSYRADDGEDHRIFSSGGVDLTNTRSSQQCVEAMDQATLIMKHDQDELLKAMAFDRDHCNGSQSYSCTPMSNGAAILACAATQRAKMQVPTVCAKERAILDGLMDKICVRP